MIPAYKAPAFNETAFNCPLCGAYSAMTWAEAGIQAWPEVAGYSRTLIYLATCKHCEEPSYWLADHYEGDFPTSGRMLHPSESTAPMPHPDMPENVRSDYEEARLIANNSPRGAAALLRLAIQKLCVHLGESGQNLNDDIASLVKKGLPVEIQQALDIVRVIGNNAVHPGVLSSGDIAEISIALFELVNQIVEERITRPKKLEALFKKLPQDSRDAIKKRDKS
jgi:hypothetical protein